MRLDCNPLPQLCEFRVAIVRCAKFGLSVRTICINFLSGASKLERRRTVSSTGVARL